MKALTRICSALIFWILAAAMQSFEAGARPNVVVILADDLGYETLGVNGGQSYSTPRLDTLARTGIRFRHAYAQPLCTPTRVQLMTGKYNVRNYDVFGVMHGGQVTFANLFRDAGYKTFIGGKWQLEGGYDGPGSFGFDEYFLWQLTRRPQRYYTPGFEANIPADGLNKVQVDYPAGVYGPDVVLQKILDFIERHPADPFLVYYPMLLTHEPYSPSPDHPDYNPATTDETNSPVYFGSMVEYMDKLVGRLVDKLDELNLRTNTLILFMGDNGTGTAVTSLLDGQSVKGGKGKTTEAGTRVPFIANWPGMVPTNQVTDALLDSTDVLPTICEAAGLPVPAGLDGRSFLPQLFGQAGAPRQWSYCWFKPQNGTEADVKECVHTARFRLYPSGQFYDIANDVLEANPLNTGALDAEAQSAFDLLTAALASFGDARLDRTLPPQPNPADWSSAPAAKGVGAVVMTAAAGADINGPAEYQFRNVTLSRDSAWQLSRSYTDSGLSDATSYTYQVRMQDVLGNATGWSTAQSATTLPSLNPRVVVIEQPATDGNSGGQNVGQSFTVPPQYAGWFLETVTFYAVTNTGGGDSGYLALYDGFTNRTSRGNVLAVSANAALNPRVDGVPITWNFTNVLLTAGRTYFAAVSDASGAHLSASQGVPAQRMKSDVYSGGSRLNETGITPEFDLKFAVTARRYPLNYAQWTLQVPAGSPTGFRDITFPGNMPNGWKYFFGLGPTTNDPSRWPRIEGGRYVFVADPKVTEIDWLIRYSSSLQAPLASWGVVETDDPAVSYNSTNGRVEYTLPPASAAFLRLEINEP